VIVVFISFSFFSLYLYSRRFGAKKARRNLRELPKLEKLKLSRLFFQLLLFVKYYVIMFSLYMILLTKSLYQLH